MARVEELERSDTISKITVSASSNPNYNKFYFAYTYGKQWRCLEI